MANEENDGIVYESNTDRWHVAGVSRVIFLPSKTRFKKSGKPETFPVRHRKVELHSRVHDGFAISFPITTRKGLTSVSDSRQKDKDCAIMPGCKGYSVQQFEQELTKLIGFAEAKTCIACVLNEM